MSFGGGQTRADRQDGFTLIEVMIVVAIFGLLMAGATVAFRNVTRSDLRSAASRTSAILRFAFDRAMLTGTYVRVVFDFDKGEVWAESTEDRVSLGTEPEEAKGEKGRKGGKEGKEGEKPGKAPARKKAAALPLFGAPAEGEGEEEAAAPGIDVAALREEWEQDLAPAERPPPAFQPVKGLAAKKIQIPDGVAIGTVATPRMKEPAQKGKAQVYFFPQGQAEPAIIHLQGRGEDVFSVVLHPMTGIARVYPCRYRIPSDFGASDAEQGRSTVRDPCAEMGGI